MKFYGDGVKNLDENLMGLLNQYRELRDFDVETYLNSKYEVFIDYVKEYGIDSVVVALSGGVDSSVVYAMLQYFKEKNKSVDLKNVYGICLPALDIDMGATNQNELTVKVEQLMGNYNEPYRQFNMTPIIDLLHNQFNLENSDLFKEDGWAKGQVVSYLRTPVYYYFTSLLSAQGNRAIVVGTTNKDEGAYLGYFGKASDGMVDVQLISDVHKREVFLIGQYLNVPKDILLATPTGDMYDNRSDEEVFGTTYDFVELYLHYLENYKSDEIENELFLGNLETLGGETLELFEKNAKNLEDMHKYNGHKYLGKSPAVHMDVIKGTEKIDGGWDYYNYEKKSKFVNLKTFDSDTEVTFNKSLMDNKILNISSENNSNVLDIDNLLDMNEVNAILTDILNKDWIPVGDNGMLKDYKEGDKIGSYRLSVFSELFADLLHKRILNYIPKYHKFTNYSNVENDNHEDWEFIGINPLFRFIKYESGGGLVPHYDWSYIQDDSTRSLVTLVIYLEHDDEYGRTRIIVDSKLNSNINTRDMSDHTEYIDIGDNDYIESVHGGIVGGGVIFNHAILHDSEPLTNGKKIIVRTDLMFKKI